MNADRTVPTNRAAASASAAPDRAPGFVRAPNGLVRWLLQHGAPLGPNALLTIRGRSSGEPRTAPIAITEVDGRRYVLGAYGDVNWTRNLRAAGEAEVRLHGRTEHVLATELDPRAAAEFFGVTLPRYVAHFPWFGRSFARILFGAVAPEILSDPAKAAATRPVFELTAVPKA